MSQLNFAVNAQYGNADIAARIFGRLGEAGKDLERLTRDDLPAIDEFHAGGRDSTRSWHALPASGRARGFWIWGAASGVLLVRLRRSLDAPLSASISPKPIARRPSS